MIDNKKLDASRNFAALYVAVVQRTGTRALRMNKTLNKIKHQEVRRRLVLVSA